MSRRLGSQGEADDFHKFIDTSLPSSYHQTTEEWPANYALISQSSSDFHRDVVIVPTIPGSNVSWEPIGHTRTATCLIIESCKEFELSVR